MKKGLSWFRRERLSQKIILFLNSVIKNGGIEVLERFHPGIITGYKNKFKCRGSVTRESHRDFIVFGQKRFTQFLLLDSIRQNGPFNLTAVQNTFIRLAWTNASKTIRTKKKNAIQAEVQWLKYENWTSSCLLKFLTLLTFLKPENIIQEWFIFRSLPFHWFSSII